MAGRTHRGRRHKTVKLTLGLAALLLAGLLAGGALGAEPIASATSSSSSTDATSASSSATETGDATTTTSETTTWTASTLEGTPTLTTDKADYGPGEVVHISGTGFAASTTYAIPVKRPDGSIVTIDPKTHVATPGWGTATTDAYGNLSYDYQLNGIYGLYEVRAYDHPWSGDWSQTPVASVTFTDALDITAKQHEGQLKVAGVLAGYTSGNVTQYAEGDTINFRFTLTGSKAATGSLEIRFTGQDTNCLFFDNYFQLGTIQSVSGATPTVTVGSGPTAQNFGTSNGEWVVRLDVTFSAAGEAVVNYQLKLSPTAGDCSGSSQHSRINAGTNVQQTGQQNVPVPASQITQKPDITITKKIDRNGDGTFESTASAGEFCFKLDSGTCVATNSSGQVVFLNVSDGVHTITEQQLNFTQGTYTFASGSGTNCAFVDSTATATVASGRPATSASCTFNNKLSKGTLIVKKAVVNDDGGTAAASAFTLHVKKGGTDVAGSPAAGSASGTSYSLDAGAYVVSEDAPPAGYTQTGISGDCDASGNVTVVAGQTKTCTITNNDVAPKLTVEKKCPSGAAATTDTFQVLLDGTATGSPLGCGGTMQVSVKANTPFTITEAAAGTTDLANYNDTYSGCASTTGLAGGSTATCTITNTLKPAP
jgi:Prealbumin-like fold domain